MKNFFKPLKLLKIAVILAIALIFYNIPLETLDGGSTICLWKRFLSIECPGCGTTRAFWCILHFEFSKALEYNKIAVFLTFPLITMLVLKWIFFEKTKTVLRFFS